MTAPSINPPSRRGLIVSIGLNVVLTVLVCGLALYAFMLNVDIDDLKRSMSKQVAARLQTERYLVETRNQLNEKLGEIERLKEELALTLAYKEKDTHAAVSPAEASNPTLPLVVNFRASILGQGLVAVIENTSDRPLTVVLGVRRPASSEVQRFTLEIGAESRADFGHLEGWEFASGDELALVSDTFRALKLTVP